MVDDDDGAGGGAEEQELISRPPDEADLVSLCRKLNDVGASYVVIGGFAIIHAGYPRMTGDLDFLVDDSLENEAKVFDAMRSLPDRAVDELDPGDIARHTVVRVADEIMVDLMGSAGGIDYSEAASEIEYREVRGVSIPFASPRLLWRMKRHTYRDKDAGDLLFLRKYFAERGERLPDERGGLGHPAL
jgi:hypothetical protein